MSSTAAPTPNFAPESFRWLHLSDLHLSRTHRSQCPNAFSAIRAAIVEAYRQTKPWHAIFFSGDMVFSGLPTEYDELTAWCGELLAELRLVDAAIDCVPWVVVPGNHDLFRPTTLDANDPHNRLRQLFATALQIDEVNAVTGVQTKRDSQFHDDYRNNSKHELRVALQKEFFANFNTWVQKGPFGMTYVRQLQPGLLPGDGTVVIAGTPGFDVGVACINTTYLDVFKEKELKALFGAAVVGTFGRLEWHVSQPTGAANLAQWAGQQVSLLMVHQDPEWMWTDPQLPSCPIRGSQQALHFLVQLCGHVHHGRLAPDQQTKGMVWIAEPLAAGPPSKGIGVAAPANAPYLRHGFSVGEVAKMYNAIGGVDLVLRRWPRSAISIVDPPGGNPKTSDRLVSGFQFPTTGPQTIDFQNPVALYPQHAGLAGQLKNYQNAWDTAWEANAVNNLLANIQAPKGTNP